MLHRNCAEREGVRIGVEAEKPATGPGGLPLFRNEPTVDFTKKGEREAFPSASAAVREKIGRTYPLFINGKEVTTGERIPFYGSKGGDGKYHAPRLCATRRKVNLSFHSKGGSGGFYNLSCIQ